MHFILIQEFIRQCGKKMGLEPEHPRAGSSDDVEGIFAMKKLSMMLFQKSSMSTQCSVIFISHFIVYTGSNDRFNDDRMASF